MRRLPAGGNETARGCRVVAITFCSPIQPAQVEGPHLGIIYSASPDTLFWGPGGPRMPLPPEHTTMKDYPVRCERLPEDWRLATLAFGRDFPPRRSQPHPSAAWVAPDGSFYPCHWLEHDGTVVRHARGKPLSQAQLDVLFALLQTSAGSYRANIGEELELSLIAERLRSGGPPGNG